MNYIDALAWLRDRAFLYGDIPSDVDVVYEAAANDGLCYLSASRRARASAGREAGLLASCGGFSVVRELASLKVAPSVPLRPLGRSRSTPEAFSPIPPPRLCGDAVAARCASTLFALEREERIVASRHGPQSKVRLDPAVEPRPPIFTSYF